LCRENGRNRTGFFAVIQQKIAHADNKTKKQTRRRVCFFAKSLKKLLKKVKNCIDFQNMVFL